MNGCGSVITFFITGLVGFFFINFFKNQIMYQYQKFQTQGITYYQFHCGSNTTQFIPTLRPNSYDGQAVG
jgi:hypothetical protein